MASRRVSKVILPKMASRRFSKVILPKMASKRAFFFGGHDFPDLPIFAIPLRHPYRRTVNRYPAPAARGDNTQNVRNGNENGGNGNGRPAENGNGNGF